METSRLYRECKTHYDELLIELERIEAGYTAGTVELFENALMAVNDAIQKLKRLMVEYEFESAAEEVFFFKELKPQFISQFIYYSKLLDIETSKPNAGQYILKEYYEIELNSLKRFVDDHHTFYEYYRRKATYMDERYFVRRQYDFKMRVDANMYNYDENFTTSHDHLVAQIMANDRLEQYLLQGISRLESYYYDKFSETSPLSWTCPKSSLVELICALHYLKSFNGGNIELSEVVRTIEKTFNVDLGNFYKTLYEIRNRKTGRTKFLQALIEGLEKHFDEMEV